MRLGKFLLTVVMVVLLSACGGGGSSSSSSDDDGINNPPTVNAGEDKSVKVNETITITGVANDSDGAIVAYEWKEGSKLLATTASFEYLPTVVGTHTLTLTVTDDEGVTASDSLVVTVTDDISYTKKEEHFAVISTDSQISESLENNFNTIVKKDKNIQAEYQTTLTFNQEMTIDLGLVDYDNNQVELKNKHKNPSYMRLGALASDEGYIYLDFKDSEDNILHTFKFIRPSGTFNGSYIEFDGDIHNQSDAHYQIGIWGYIYIKNGKLTYDGEYFIRYHSYGCNGLCDGLASKTWNISDFDKIKKITISIGALATYDNAKIALFVEH